MTLYEMSFAYEESCELLRERMRELRKAEKTATDTKERQRIKQRLAELDPMMREMRELAALTKKYYEGSYYRNEKYSL